LLRQSAEADGRLIRKPEQPRQTERLDYGAQVAAYQEQLKAQEDAQKAKEAEEAKKLADQEALVKQQQAAQKQPAQKQQLKSSPRVNGGGIGGLGKSANFKPKPTGGQKK
jgi:hypothetical protein